MSAIAVLALLFVMMSVKIVHQGYRFTIEHFGRFTRVAEPGFNFVPPFFYRVGRRINMNGRRDAFDKLIGPIGLSSFCLLTLVGIMAYSGSVVPSTQGASTNAAIVIWLFWAALVAVPTVTLCLWMVTLRRNKKPKV